MTPHLWKSKAIVYKQFVTFSLVNILESFKQYFKMKKMRLLHSRVQFCEIFVSVNFNRHVTSHKVNVFLIVAYLIKGTTVVSSA